MKKIPNTDVQQVMLWPVVLPLSCLISVSVIWRRTLKFVHDSKLADEVNVLCDRAGIQGDADRLEEWADMNPLKLRRGLCKDLHFRWSTVYWVAL